VSNSDRTGERPGAGSSAAAAASNAGADASGQPHSTQKAIEPADRPGASGHRFGPDLACSECGITWDAHQREPAPCVKDEPEDTFLRRPAIEEPS